MHTTTGFSLKRAILAFKNVFLTLFLFELITKLLSLCLLRPAGKKLTVLMLNITGENALFNYHMLQVLLSLPGIAAAVLILCLSAFLSYFEFSVLILKISSAYQGASLSLKEACKGGAVSLETLSNYGILGFFVYSILLLPFEGIYITPSIMPYIQIPNFATGEFLKRWYGGLVLYSAYAVVFVCFLLLLFVLPAMLLKKQTFFKACLDSLTLWKKLPLKACLLLGTMILFWVLLFLKPGILPTDFSSVYEENLLKTVCMLFFSGKALQTAAAGFCVWALRTLLMLFFLTVLTGLYLSVHKEAAFSENTIRKEPVSFLVKMEAAQGAAAKYALQARQYFRPLLKRISISRKTLVFACCLLLLGGFFFLRLYAYAPPYLHAPLNIGHRGSDRGIENTIPAILGAIDSGADFVELDIQISADRIPVAMHDDNLSRLAGRRDQVRDLTYEELSQIPLSQYGLTGNIPSLEEILKLTDQKIKLLIELKAGSPEEKEPLVSAVLALIEKYNFENQCILMSLDYDLVAMCRQENPALKVGYCMFGRLGESTVEDLLALSVDFIVIEENMVSRSFLSSCRRAWLPVYVWTVDKEEAMRKYLDMGAVGLISDKPYLTKEVLKDYPSKGAQTACEYFFGK